jgi:hypothetical protein
MLCCRKSKTAYGGKCRADRSGCGSLRPPTTTLFAVKALIDVWQRPIEAHIVQIWILFGRRSPFPTFGMNLPSVGIVVLHGRSLPVSVCWPEPLHFLCSAANRFFGRSFSLHMHNAPFVGFVISEHERQRLYSRPRLRHAGSVEISSAALRVIPWRSSCAARVAKQFRCAGSQART